MPPSTARRATPSGSARRDARGRRASSYELSLREQVDDLLGGGAVVFELERVSARRRIAERANLRAGAALADVILAKPELGDGQALLRLRLRAHDPLERRVARLV